MLSQQEISDRLEITDLMARYAHAVDSRQWDLLDDLFTADAYIDYTATGGAAGDLAAAKKFLAEVLPNFLAYQHFVGNAMITVDGDTATARSMCHNPMVMSDGQGGQRVLLNGLWYVDELARIDDRWRLRRRHQEMSYQLLVP
ncbi:nuclear transport factor 2 family protein [Nocardia sp. alder85J]|uniref:nuclear transport factor 2 family protein n=1 Tax=Nocardia sp. alder85J TaxID=2862949 RepID=UPI001CD6463E|nr:nuclear transport factor 2 family protein [Nocardia sp. alder85J]MCX4097015.1 nuclear transport factor 2 family protein [Nocardia sp. alder85J]